MEWLITNLMSQENFSDITFHWDYLIFLFCFFNGSSVFDSQEWGIKLLIR